LRYSYEILQEHAQPLPKDDTPISTQTGNQVS